MAKFQSPLLGYNNNVRHKNRVFHIQTEDSGVGHPHIITHLFMDGGRILKSVKTSYAEHVGSEAMKETVRGMMKEQHKAMFIALRDGQFDHLVDPGAKPAAKADAPAAAESSPAVAAAPAPAPAPDAPAPSADDAAAAAAPVPSAAPVTNPDPPRVDVDLPPNTIDETKRPAVVEAAPAPAVAAPVARSAPPAPRAPSAPPAPPAPRAPSAPPVAAAAPRIVVAATDPEDVPMTTRQPAEARPDAIAASAKPAAPSARELTLDLDALEQSSQDKSSLFHSQDLPPPPKNLFAAKEPVTGGAYLAVEAEAEPRRRDPREESTGRSDPREEPPTRERSRSQPAARPAAAKPASDARYAPARPAAIFGNAQRPQPQSLFSDELVSDKSLDEVILSYLAEDLEPPRRK